MITKKNKYEDHDIHLFETHLKDLKNVKYCVKLIQVILKSDNLEINKVIELLEKTSITYSLNGLIKVLSEIFAGGIYNKNIIFIYLITFRCNNDFLQTKLNKPSKIHFNEEKFLLACWKNQLSFIENFFRYFLFFYP